MGTTTGTYSTRTDQFSKAVKEYQTALLSYRDAMRGASPQNKQLAKQMVIYTHRNLQGQFNQELNAIVAKNRARAPLTNAERGINIARSSRNAVKLEVVNQVQANNLVYFAKHAQFLGNGLAVIDFSSRAGNVHTAYLAKSNWEKELFVESSSFALSAYSGMVTVNAGLGLLMAATPVGWVAIVVGGVAVAASAAAVSMGVNHVTKQYSGNLYDLIMEKLGLK